MFNRRLKDYFRMIKLGLGKGKGLIDSINLLQTAGIELPIEFIQGKLPYVRSSLSKITVVLLRQCDLPWALDSGYIDMAIGSGIWFRENELNNNVKLMAMGLQKIRLSLIVPKGTSQPNSAINTVCTRFPNLTSKWENKSYYTVKDIIYMSGSIETALILGIADGIVDIINTGWTLNKLELIELETLMTIEQEIWVSKSLGTQQKNQIKKMFPQYEWNILSTAE